MTSGRFVLNGRSMDGVAPSKRDIAMVFQSYALYPHMDVRENMAFGVRLMGLPKPEIERRIRETAAMLQLEPLLGRRPRELSGGQRQRVAIGRALVRKPALFLLDEPLSNLDAALRADVRLEIAKLHREIGGTMIYVTHDQVEAMTLADRIVVMNGGRIEQVGTPRELYERPANTFVGTFIGSPRMALVGAERAGGRLSIPGSGAVALTAAPGGAGPVTLGVRPDGFEIAPAGEGYRAAFEYSEYLGNESYVYARLGCGTRIGLRAGPERIDRRPGDAVTLRPVPGALHFFDSESGMRLAS
jgi:multiple sugar transport system ATP-binding protein